jgi:hypothetical protein
MMLERLASTWKEVYQKAVHETAGAEIQNAVLAAEGEMFVRLQELGNSSEDQKERDEIRAATEDLLEIKIHRLAWPKL